MKKYGVCMPVTGYVYMEVEANNEEEALDFVYENATLNDIGEWELTDYVCKGNVSYAVMSEYEIYEI